MNVAQVRLERRAMVDIKALKQIMATKGWSAEKLADALGIDRSTLFRRFQSNGADFTVEEVNAIVSALGLSREDAHSIFFPNNVA